ncbi:glycosyltransferase family 2 protein [Pseudosporangium ferrugineum]|uniref:Glycosyltransferase involved in cell wall biosynthesis n=1 Tax=Pseudosporangium ferrugineum TaxID=439699 RepID=A0A2T0SJ54_9ACTN|nr:glycosyltransferase family 2 protein [Pseudosporangium ferrugineum]PRY33442.1 glycosyltransferase involved in cell wall biosynthesis [Pseudosporangium ferrugineum]
MPHSSTPGTTPSNGHSSPTVSVVIPTLNEERNLPHVFAKLPAGIDEVIVVDGGSVDRTVEVARELRPDVVIVQQTRTGKGNALACGFAACTGDLIVMIDADGSTDPAEIPLFVAQLVDGADFVKGSRFSHGGHSHDITRLRKLGNDGLNLVVNVLFGTRFTDLCYGYNAFWRRVVPVLDLPDTTLPRPADGAKLWGDGFEIETMINIRAAADGMRVGEVGSVEHARIHGQSNLNTFRDGFRVLRTIFSEYGRMRRRRRLGVTGNGVRVHQRTAGTSANNPPRHALAKVVNRPPAASVSPATDPRQHVAHLNRGLRRDETAAVRHEEIPGPRRDEVVASRRDEVAGLRHAARED